MVSNISRRDFLKLLSVFGTGYFLPGAFFQAAPQQALPGSQNVLLIVFDAWSSQNISLYGYPRKTTPYLDSLAERAVIYHNHFTGGNFTTPGTASLLTGTLPWTHRAINHNDTVKDDFIDKSIFHAFSSHYRMAYSHNPLVNTFFKQFFADIENLTPREKLFLEYDVLPTTVFENDEDIASVSWERVIKQTDGYSYSMFFSRLYDFLKQRNVEDAAQQFPRGIPKITDGNTFKLDDGIDWLQRSISEAPAPFMAYYHFLPPHFPYNTRIDFYRQFQNDGYHPMEKPRHAYFAKDRSQAYLDRSRQKYDEFVLYCDAEFNRLYRFMEQQGILENTWLVLTSDHGEMFERGIGGHITPTLFNPLMKIPLVIFPPGQQERIDIHAMTSAIDVLPTLTQVTGQPMPEWTEGQVLPPFNDDYLKYPPDVIGVRGRGIDKDEPVNRGTFMIVHENHKGVYYMGYEDKVEQWGDYFEVFDLDNDPEELDNLAESHPDIAQELGEILRERLDEANKDYNK